jgi:dipeptide/tripeptide permease
MERLNGLNRGWQRIFSFIGLGMIIGLPYYPTSVHWTSSYRAVWAKMPQNVMPAEKYICALLSKKRAPTQVFEKNYPTFFNLLK